MVRTFEARPELTSGGRLVITGTGVAAEEARTEILSQRVEMLGLVDGDRLERELVSADVAF